CSHNGPAKCDRHLLDEIDVAGQKSSRFITGHSPGFVLCALLCKDGVGNFEVAVRRTSVADCVPSTIKLLLHRGLADWAKERPRQRSIPNSLPNQYHGAMSVQDTTASGGISGR